MNTTELMNTTALRNAAQKMSGGGGLNIPRLKYVKGEWLIGKVKVNGRELGARPDWVHRGWSRLWDGKLTWFFGGYVTDNWSPPPRETLPDNDQDEWEIYCGGRDPWVLQWGLPFFDTATGQLFIWSTDTNGGEAAIKSLLNTYCDRVEMHPEDGTILPVEALNSGGYKHPSTDFWVDTPLGGAVA